MSVQARFSEEVSATNFRIMAAIRNELNDLEARTGMYPESVDVCVSQFVGSKNVTSVNLTFKG